MLKSKKTMIIILIALIVICLIAACFGFMNKQEVVNNEKDALQEQYDDKNDISNEKLDDEVDISNEELNNKKIESEVLQKQLNLILNNKNVWYKDTEVDKYSYAVTDLNQNGRLEIITSICQGTGLYTYTEIYEANENIDNLQSCSRDEAFALDSEADIIKNQLPLFYDSATNTYHYVLEDMLKDGATDYYENKRDFYLSDGRIIEEYLAFKNTIYVDGKAQISCRKKGDLALTLAEYDDYENNYFKNLEKMVANVEWLQNYTEINLEDLENSYNKFSIYKVNNMNVNASKDVNKTL